MSLLCNLSEHIPCAICNFLQGLSQFFSGSVSDKVGRKWIIFTGLLLIAAGLLTADFGMGFNGRYLVGRTSDEISQQQFGTFLLSAILLG